MTKLRNGGPAFPSGAVVEKYPNGEAKSRASGMTLRDYFAAKALTALVGVVGMPEDQKKDELWNSDMARQAYELADAMLERRER